MHGIMLDHVALAVERWEDAWPRLRADLGGQWRSHGYGPGFAPSQLGFANGMKVELIMPNQVEANDFLRRFLDANGSGPHHLTFKVDDIEAALGEVAAAGHQVVGVDLSDPTWKEAFLHPKRSGAGVVVQLAEAKGPDWVTEPVAGFPEPSRAAASLLHVGHAVASLRTALSLFRDLLGGTPVADGGDEASRWVELAWPGAGRVRLLEPADGRGPIADWLAGREGRVHHLAFACVDPASVPGAIALASGDFEVAPDERIRTRLLLLPR